MCGQVIGRAARLTSLTDDSLREMDRAGSLSLWIRRKGCADGGLGYREDRYQDLCLRCIRECSQAFFSKEKLL